MGKLGKKARKFAKKNLQSVLRRKRKVKSTFKKKASKRDERDAAENEEEDNAELSNRRNHAKIDIEDTSLDAIFSEDDSDVDRDDSGSDGYLSEDSNCASIAESETHLGVSRTVGELSVQNQEIHSEIENKKKKLNRLKSKDPEFAHFLESRDKDLKSLTNEDACSDEDERSDDGMQSIDEDGPNLYKSKLFTSSAVSSWCQLVKEQHRVPALISLLNAYRAACHYGADSTGVLDTGSCPQILDSETFCKIWTFMLREADDVFRAILGVSTSNCKKGTILELKNTSKWKTLRPLIKSYLRSTLFMLNQATDSNILAFSLTRLRASIVFFAAFPPLLYRLIKIGVHLWATGGGTLSSHSFLILQDVASVFGSDCFDTCLIKMYKAFINNCIVEPVLFKHIQFLRNSFVELCSQDLQKSSSKAMVSIQKLSTILQLGLRTKKKEAVKKICSWQYTNCIDLWVTYISHNIRDYDLQLLLYIIIQIINGVAVLFPGPRYLPLRRKCIEWLNHLSSSSAIFIPVTSLVLDVLEYKIGKEGGTPGKDFNFSSAVKLPKYWLKSRNFQEECVFSALELLAVHFAYWSYHISFPELATIPLIRLKKFQEKTAIESFRRVVKHFIDLVEQNVDYVQKNRDEVAFSPKDQQSVETFLQLEKCSSNAPFTQYYRSIMEKAASRGVIMDEKLSFLEQKKLKGKKGRRSDIVNGHANGEKIQEKRKADQSVDDGRLLK